ncbi:MAG: hypothetical protein GX069_08800 [Tissierellia bacterium]|nr:hypothetical protein [Tissierellia bacterium]
MFYKKKLERAMKWLKEKNRVEDRENSLEEYEGIELEKKDIIAIIISAILVFGPLFLIAAGIIYLLFKYL